LLGLIRDHKVRKGCFWHALAELRRLKLISEGRLPNPLETLMIEIAILCDMSHNFEQQMNPNPKQKRERFQQLTQNPKVKTGKAFAADLQKSRSTPRSRNSPPGAN
jgi:hypothetical protein